MTDELAEVRRHVEAAAALLRRLDVTEGEADDRPADDFAARARMGVELTPEVFAELVELAAHLRMTPALTLKLALRALTVELSKHTSKGPGRLVGKERGLLEGKR